MSVLYRWKDRLVVAGVLLLILGLRISMGIHVVAAVPQGDDYRVLSLLQHWSNTGKIDWHLVWWRTNGHFFVFYYLVNLLQYKLNGFWDPRLDFLTYAFIHTLEAAVVLLTFRSLLAERDRGWLYTFVFFLFATPFGGYRIGWGNLYADTCVIVFALPAIYGAVCGRSWLAFAAVVVAAGAGCLNLAAGCLGAFTVSIVLVLRACVLRRVDARELALAAITFLFFLACMVTLPGGGTNKIGILEAANAFLKAIAWPVVFTPLAGLATLVPFAGLAAVYLLVPRFRTAVVEFTLGSAILVCLISLATGTFRGDNANLGMPSGRYVDLFLIVPLTALAALCLLCRGTAGPWRKAWMAYAWLWCGLQLLGFSIHILYRTIPFIGNQNGEWVEPSKLTTFRNAARDPKLPVYLKGDPTYDINFDVEHYYFPPADIRAFVHGTKPLPAMTLPMITGFPLLPAQGNYVAGGYPPAYAPRPGENYVGSFDPNNRRTPKSYTSPPFTPTAPYITLNLLLDKKARFANYHLPTLDLALVDQTAGRRLELLPRLASTFPFLFRDWELIDAPVTPGHAYVLESSATDATPTDWLAFSEPTESGRLTPFTIGVTQSGKLLCLIALGLLAFSAGLHRDYFGMLRSHSEDDDSSPDRR